MTIKHVHTVTARGKTYRYAWRGGPRLFAQPSDPAFLAEIAAVTANSRKPDPSVINGLITAYRGSQSFADLAPGSRRNWQPWLDRIGTHFGRMAVADFDHPASVRHIRTWRDKYRATPRTADMAMQCLSRLLSFAGEEGLLLNNPCARIPGLYRADRSDLIWTDADLTELAVHAPADITRAARLAALTGLRKGDLLRLSWSHVGPRAIEIATGKSGGRKTTLIPIYAQLRTHLETIPRRSTTVLTSATGRPWGSGFNAAWNKAKIAAELQRLHFHDLRGTAATRFYIGGLSIRMIAEIMTWSETRVGRLIDRYVKRDELLIEAIRALDRNTPATPIVKPM